MPDLNSPRRLCGSGAEELAEVGDCEGYGSSFGGEHQAFFDEAVSGWGEGLGFAVEGAGDFRGRDGAVVYSDAQFGHGSHVLAFGGGGSFVAGAEEADGEFGGGLGGGDGDVFDGDRAGGGVVPGGVGEGLHEVR